MTISHSWSRLCRAKASAQRRWTDRLLARHLREEVYPFSRHYRRVLEAAEVDPRRLRGVADLAAIPPSSLAELRAVEPAELVLTPTPHAMREHWGFGRKLALVLAGRRSGEHLVRGYAPALTTEEEGLALTSSAGDLELVAELGARVLDMVGLACGSEVVDLLGEEGGFARELLQRGATQAGVRLVPAGGEARALLLSSAGARALPEDAGDLGALELLLVAGTPLTDGERAHLAEHLARAGATRAAIASLWIVAPARMALVELPWAPDQSPAGHWVSSDLCAVEVVDPALGRPVPAGHPGEVLLTPLGFRGTALLRYRTGVLASGGLCLTPCPRSGRTLPRLIGLRPLER